MASTVINGSYTGSTNYKFFANVSSVPDTPSNSSQVTVSIYIQKLSGSGYYNTSNHDSSININGNNAIKTNTTFDTRPTTAPILLYSRTQNVPHNADGTKTCSISATHITETGLGNGSLSGSLILDPIPRKSTGSVGNFTIENAIPIVINEASPSFTHTLQFYVNNVLCITRTGVLGSVSSITPTSAENTAMYNAIPDALNKLYYMVITTYDGATNLGSYTTSNANVFINSITNAPTFNNFTYSESNSVVTALTGGLKYIKNYSNLATLISSANKAVGKNGASIVKYTYQCGSKTGEKTYSTGDVNLTLNAIDSNIIIITAWDSRGLTKSVSKSFTLLEYTNPTISTIITERTDGVGTDVQLALNGKIWNGNYNGSAPNIVKKVDYRTKPQSSSTWSSYFDITSTFNSKVTNTSGNLVLELADDLKLHADGSSGGFTFGTKYDIQVRLYDGITTATFNNVVGISTVNDGKILDSFYKDESGDYHSGYHQMPSDTYAHEFSGDVNINGDLTVNGNPISGGITLLDVYPVGAIYISTVNTSPATLFGGTWAVFGTGRTLVGFNSGDTDFNASEKTGGSKTHTHGSAPHTHTVNSHTHTSAAHTHGSGSLYAQLAFYSTTSIIMNRLTGLASWADNFYKTVAGGTGSSPGSNTVGVNVEGTSSSTTPGATGGTALTTNSTTPADTDSSSSLQPYITVYMWKRTA